MKKLLVILLNFIVLTQCFAIEKNRNCVLRGKVINRDSKALVLTKAIEDARCMSITIPIDDDNTFEYELKNPEFVRYSLIFEDDMDSGMLTPIYFVPDSKTIEFELYPTEHYVKNNIKGSKLTAELLNFEKKAREIFEPQFNTVNTQLQSLYNTGQGMSSEAKELQHKTEAIMVEFMHWRLTQIKTAPSIAMYSLLVDMILASKDLPHINKDELTEIVLVYNGKFPDHFYTEQSKLLIKALSTIKIGGTYADFSAPNLNGKEVKISDIIKANKITLINLWAPWCAPCRFKSRGLIAIYEKYRHYGFEIIGVVGGIDKIDLYKVALAQEKYPWPNLIELKNSRKIWEKYNISNAGGGMFLVNAKGIILAIDPTQEELEKILQSLE